MNTFMINLFVPRTIDGSAAAIAAHFYAERGSGTVSVVRYEDDDELNEELEKLVCNISAVKKIKAPLPERRAIWVIGGTIYKKTYLALNPLCRTDEGVMCVHPPNASALYLSELLLKTEDCTSIYHFFRGLAMKNAAWENIEFLYNMLEDDEFEHLIAYLLKAHPHAQDVTKEDYVLSLFVDHEKKRRERYV